MTEPPHHDPHASALGPGAEFDRIRRVLARLGGRARGIGDDCARLPDGEGAVVVSVDLSIEGVHFRRDWLTLEEIGWRAAAAALSDLAAEGAVVSGVLASVGCPATAPEDDLVALMAGVGAAVHQAGGVVLGGDLTASPHWVVDITVLGRAYRPVTRAGARPGDSLWISGELGGARAALHAWRAGSAPDASARAAFAHPVPRIHSGLALARAGARAMLDLSDGLGGDAGHLAAASGVALQIDLARVPPSPAAVAAALREGIPAPLFAALGGEDYELLAAMPQGFGEPEAARIAEQSGVPLTRVGVVTAGTGVSFMLGGRTVSLAGFDHFQ